LSNRFQYVKHGGFSSSQGKILFGVPQGSVLGPLFFTTYISPLAGVIASFGISSHQYADDTQLFISLSKLDWNEKIGSMELCLSSVYAWLSSNYLALNTNKTEVILLGTSKQVGALNSLVGNVDVAGSSIPMSTKFKTLGVTLDQQLSFTDHVQSVTNSCWYHIRALRDIRPLLNTDSATMVALGIVGSRLDYCNSLLYGISAENIGKLQRIQNTLARIVTSSSRWSSSAPLLERLHWLPIEQRIKFKICTVTFKVKHFGQPQYLRDQLTMQPIPIRSTRSSGENLNNFAVPHANIKMAERSFRVAAPTLWNSLPLSARQATSLQVFRGLLKTHFFKINQLDHH
jgi:hypothetical protein